MQAKDICQVLEKFVKTVEKIVFESKPARTALDESGKINPGGRSEMLAKGNIAAEASARIWQAGQGIDQLGYSIGSISQDALAQSAHFQSLRQQHDMLSTVYKF